MLPVPPLETERLLIRPFTMEDLDAIYQILDIDLLTADMGSEQAKTRAERERWLQWTIWSYEELAKLYQPPYGDRAVVHKHTRQVIGACGFVPSFGPFGQLPSMPSADQEADAHFNAQVGMRIEKNPYPDPSWFQVVGILENGPANALQTGP